MAEDSIIRSPDLPFVSMIVGGVFAGRSIIISGMVLPASGKFPKFNVDLCCGLLISGDHMDNKALHINPRFEKAGGWFSGKPDDQLVLNSYISNTWGPEERYENPFEEGKPFQMRILVLENYFKIAVNGRHVCDYEHRMKKLDFIRTIAINGNVRIDFVEFQPAIGRGADGEPIITNPVPNQEKNCVVDNPVAPYKFDLPELGFCSPQKLRFTLTPLIAGERFVINLIKDNGDIGFHFRVDLPNAGSKPAVVRNNFKDGKWQTEEREMGKFPFNKGITHDVVFHAHGKSLAVDVDGAPFIRFNYRGINDADLIKEVMVEGDAILKRYVHTTFESPNNP